MLLLIVLFVCGAVVMSVEILATRVFASSFGSTLHVWGALIGTFIGALSLGYYVGGLLADRWPTRKGLGVIILAAGALILGMEYPARSINDYIWAMDIGGEGFPWMGPLVATAVLYGLPVALLGIVSPYCVRLATTDLRGLGRRVGSFYAVSSLGSIFGTFLTAFYLVGEFRVSLTIRTEGVVLMFLSVPLFVVGFFFERRRPDAESGNGGDRGE